MARTTQVNFKECKITARAKTPDGKRCQKTFSATVNPFNKNDDGTVKTERDVYDELIRRGEAWKLQIEQPDTEEDED